MTDSPEPNDCQSKSQDERDMNVGERTTMDLVVLLTTSLVSGGLTSALVAIWLSLTRSLVGGIGDALLHLVGGRLGGFWGHVLLRLVGH